MTSQRLLAGSGWSPPWALPGAVRDEADGVQGGCREEISQLPAVPAATRLFGKEQTFKSRADFLQIEADTKSDQIRKMAPLLGKKT